MNANEHTGKARRRRDWLKISYELGQGLPLTVIPIILAWVKLTFFCIRSFFHAF